MAQRTVALCDGKYIGIETIFTVINGKQINIPDKLEALRQKSRAKQLFCSCGCGSNLILVASENNLREQHFRLKSGIENAECQVVTEGKRSVDSKIVIKCWLDDKLDDSNLESRVPVSEVSDLSRKYEFTFLSKQKAIGISYCHDRVNISDEKLKFLANNSSGIKLIHILDACNFKADSQYPEAEMKIQSEQGFCLLLDIDDLDYYKASMRTVFYAQDIDGLWEEVTVCDGKLSEYNLNHDGISFDKKLIAEKTVERRREYDSLQISRKTAREEEQRRLELERIEQIKRQEEEAKRREQERIEWQKRQEQEAEIRRIEAEKRAAEIAAQKAQQEKERAEKAAQAEIQDREYVEANINQQEVRVVDSRGNRWIKCEFCGKVAKEKEFSSYGGANHINLGTCYDCQKNNPAVKESLAAMASSKPKKEYDPTICPDCGGKIIEKIGPYGKFKTCSNYPRCKYKPGKRW